MIHSLFWKELGALRDHPHQRYRTAVRSVFAQALACQLSQRALDAESLA
jgi:hypothetical protein